MCNDCTHVICVTLSCSGNICTLTVSQTAMFDIKWWNWLLSYWMTWLKCIRFSDNESKVDMCVDCNVLDIWLSFMRLLIQWISCHFFGSLKELSIHLWCFPSNKLYSNGQRIHVAGILNQFCFLSTSGRTPCLTWCGPP